MFVRRSCRSAVSVDHDGLVVGPPRRSCFGRSLPRAFACTASTQRHLRQSTTSCHAAGDGLQPSTSGRRGLLLATAGLTLVPACWDSAAQAEPTMAADAPPRTTPSEPDTSITHTVRDFATGTPAIYCRYPVRTSAHTQRLALCGVVHRVMIHLPIGCCIHTVADAMRCLHTGMQPACRLAGCTCLPACSRPVAPACATGHADHRHR